MGAAERRPAARMDEAMDCGISGGFHDLHPNTLVLIQQLAYALACKLAAAEKKYGYSDNWMRPGWMDECRAHLRQHVAKGDPLDVAAYCAFLWHHNERTAIDDFQCHPPPCSLDEALAVIEKWAHVGNVLTLPDDIARVRALADRIAPTAQGEGT